MKNILFGATSAGIKQPVRDANNSLQNKKDLAIIILPEGSVTSAVFTKNAVCAAPVIIGRKHIHNDVRALIINSGNANAGTGIASGEIGYDNALHICKMVAHELNIHTHQVLPFSTGVIGQKLPMQCFTDTIKHIITTSSENQLPEVAEAIMTTDTYAKLSTKVITINNKKVTITGIAKGSGMIHPNMATMLSFIFTDIIASKEQLDNALHNAVNKSFNRITVDGDTSTNDSLTLTATGASGVPICDEFTKALEEVMINLAQQIVKDGEGATKFVTITTQANSAADALKVCYSVAHSLLVKTALFASDANWGRILSAVGNSNVKDLSQNMITIYLGDVCLIENGEFSPTYTEEAGSNEMKKDEITISISIGKGYQETIWTTDLSYDYIKINAEYRT